MAGTTVLLLLGEGRLCQNSLPVTPAPSTWWGTHHPAAHPPGSPPALGGRGLPAGVFDFYKNTFCKMDVRKAPTSPPPRELRAAPERPSLPPVMSEQGPGRRPPRPGRRSQTPTRPACPQRGAGARARTAGAAGAQPLCAWGSGLGHRCRPRAAWAAGGPRRPHRGAAHTQAAARRSREQATHMHAHSRPFAAKPRQQNSQGESRAPGQAAT